MKRHTKLTSSVLALALMLAMCSCSEQKRPGAIKVSDQSKREYGISEESSSFEPDVTWTDPAETTDSEETTDAKDPADTTSSQDPSADAPVYNGDRDELMKFLQDLIGKDVKDAESLIQNFFKIRFSDKYTSNFDDWDRYTFFGYFYIYDVQINTVDLKCVPGTTTVSYVSFWTLSTSKEDIEEDVATLTGMAESVCGEPLSSFPLSFDEDRTWANYIYASEEGYSFYIYVFLGESGEGATITFDFEECKNGN